MVLMFGSNLALIGTLTTMNLKVFDFHSPPDYASCVLTFFTLLVVTFLDWNLALGPPFVHWVSRIVRTQS